MKSILKWFRASDPNEAALPLYTAIVEAGRQPHWYLDGAVPDTIDGRFDMIAALLSLVLIRLEAEPDRAQDSVYLTELFVEDMDSQLRQIGIGDYVVGKHVGRMMSALGGRLGALRDVFAGSAALEEVLRRNLYRGTDPSDDAIAYVAGGLRQRYAALAAMPSDQLMAGETPL